MVILQINKKYLIFQLLYYFNIVDYLSCQTNNNRTGIVGKIKDINKEEIVAIE